MAHGYTHTAVTHVAATKSGQAFRVTWIGLVINVLLTAAKFLCGLFGLSQAVVADAFHSLSDCTTDVAVLVGIPYWSAPADRNHPHGHRRIETLVTTFIAIALAVVGIGLVYNAITTLKERHSSPTWIALAAALTSIVVKEFLYRWTNSVGRRIKSSALVANAWHHRSDALSSIPASLAVVAAMISPTWSFVDHIGAVVVSVFILGAAWKIGWPALKQLMDAGAPEKAREQISKIALGVEQVCRIHAVRTRYMGDGLAVDLHIKVDGDLTVREGHEISELVKRRLLDQGPDLVDVVVHLEPCDEEHKR